MSSPMLPITGPSGPPNLTPATGADDADPASFMSELDRAGRGPRIDAARIGPPQEALDEIATAAELYDELRRAGYEVRFADKPSGQPSAIELRDPDGNVRRLSAAEAIDVAAGGPLR